MTVVYIAIACIVAYGLLILFRQVQALTARVTQLEHEKRETEALLLSFMESMNDVVKHPLSLEEVADAQAVHAELDRERSDDETQSAPHVEDVLLHHSVRETARLLGKGEGEVALYAKLRKK
ncbi:hypothetical protein [Exiguobacterium aurantiacum]|uniref:DUF2802 domain-containing protein n=1 Tax=Exiguobacterium aurantiacum TaxID=33987 RepID=A0ABY5FJN6_9BACL|nr:hypothetical protein [Exiguobacterium aurantiacum]UTT41772.1 hypothetical protein NMQ00_09365 [Exiguobacterium aurantiacum]